MLDDQQHQCPSDKALENVMHECDLLGEALRRARNHIDWRMPRSTETKVVLDAIEATLKETGQWLTEA